MSRAQVGYVETSTGAVGIIADPAAIAAWSPASGAWTLVKLLARYFPATRAAFPQRGANNAGETVAFPAPEAAALIAAGYATAVAGTANQIGVGEN